jgi:hypothetical protein
MSEFMRLAAAGRYGGGTGNDDSCARFARRKFVPNIPVYQLPGSGLLLKKEDIDAYLEKFRRDPINLDDVVADIFRIKPGPHK